MIDLPRFYPILDSETLARRDFPMVDAAEALLEAGARIIQIRHKGHYPRATFQLAEQIASMCRAAGALCVVNDRADIAILLDAALHLGQDDLAPAAARRLIGHSRRLGFSTHNESQLRAALAEPVDYVAIGPIFATGSKRNPDPVVGIEELRRLRPLITLPLVAIGGVTIENAHSVYDAGADSIAVISALYPDPCSKAAIRENAEAWIRSLEASRGREVVG